MAETLTSRTRTPVCPADLTPECPWCKPDWRWLRASWRNQSRSRRGERQDDDWTLRAMRCLNAIHREARGRRPYRPEPDLRLAWQIAQPQDWRRAELEARILADQPVTESSSAMGGSLAVISAYEALFFDVRQRREACGWIIYEVVGLRPWGPLQPQDVGVAWMFLGFLYGAATVDTLVAGAERADLERFGLPTYWTPRSRLPKELQLLLVTRSLPEHGRKALRSLTRLVDLGLGELPPCVEAPPKSLALDLSGGLGNLLAAWTEQPDKPCASPEESVTWAAERLLSLLCGTVRPRRTFSALPQIDRRIRIMT